MNIRMIVVGANSSGEADAWPCIVDCNEEQYNNGDHFLTASDAAENRGYENTFAADEHEPLFKPFEKIINWLTVPRLVC